MTESSSSLPWLSVPGRAVMTIGVWARFSVNRTWASTSIRPREGRRIVLLPITPTYSATKAALHSFSKSLRVQLARAENSMPLDDFLTETLDLLRERPDAHQLVVERARFVRDTGSNGSYDDVLAMLSGV